jgi:hypothetical protein
MRGSTLTGWATYIVERCEAAHAKYHSEQAGPKEPPVQTRTGRSGVAGGVLADYAALRLTLLSAIVVSFLSAAFSSFSVCSSRLATSLRPSRLAQAISEP